MEEKEPKTDEPKPNEEEAGTKIIVHLEYDLVTNQLQMISTAPSVMVLGVMAMAHSTITQKHILQSVKKMAEEQKKKIEIVPAGGGPRPQ